MAPWKLPVIVLGIVAPIVAAFALGGAGVGVAVGALAAVAIVVVAARQRPRGKILSAAPHDARRHVLLVISRPLESPEAVRRVIAEAGVEGNGVDTELLVLSPARIGFLERWASDLEGARRRAQRNLVITVASLARADIAAEARVGDEDLVQAVEDQLRTFPATEVILASGGREDAAGTAAAAELGSRLGIEFSHLALAGEEPA